MKKYIAPEMEIIKFEKNDIIQTSTSELELNGANAGTVKYDQIPGTAELYDIKE